VLGMARGHVLWIFDPANRATDMERVPDLAVYPELQLLDRYPHAVPVLTAAATFGLGELLASVAPGLQTSGMQMLVWAFCISTVAIYHVTFSVNSIGHRFGHRRYQTTDDSRNSSLLAPPPLPRRGATGLRLVGTRPHVARPPDPERRRRGARPASGPGRGARRRATGMEEAHQGFR
jgi:hypothetical protein